MEVQNYQQLEQLKKVEEMKKQVLSKVLSKEAFERLARVRAVNPELAGQADLYLLQVYQSGKLQGLVEDSQLKEVLKYLSLASQKETVIKRV